MRYPAGMTTTVHIVLRRTTPKVTSLADVFAASREAPAEIVGVYFDELKAARDAGKVPDSWYLSYDVIGDDPASNERVDILTPAGGQVDVSMLRNVLSLVGQWDPAQDLTNLTPIERMVGYDWAMREHLSASDNPIERRDCPSFLVQQ